MTNMADNNMSTPTGKIPPHIESYLTAKRSCSFVKIKPRKYFCVLFGNLIQCFGNKKSYTEKRENVKAQIDLELVRSISETVSLPASRQKQEYCFKLVFYDDNEVDFIAQSKQDVKNWVECLRQTKEFWENWEPNKLEIINTDKCNVNRAETYQESSVKVPDEEGDPDLIKISIIMSHGQPFTTHLPPDGNLDDLWTAVLKSLPGHFCFKCNICQLRGSTMELWSVTNDGAAYKIEKHFNASEYCTTASNPIYLLEHNFKLLVVFFEDSSFLVSPADISTKARDIPDIELFSRKLSEIGCNNVQLYLKTSSVIATPFSQDDAPLRTLWEPHGDKWALKHREGEKFLLKSKVILRDSNPKNIAEKIQQSKLITKIYERKQHNILKKIEFHGCKPKINQILDPLRTPASQALPFEASLTSSIDMNEDHFCRESRSKTKAKHQIQPCTFPPSPEKKGPGQLNAPFCPPDSLEFTSNTSKPNAKVMYGSHEVTVRRQRSLTDVTHCLRDRRNFTTALSKSNDEEKYDIHEVAARRQRSVTDVTPHRTGSNNERYLSHAGSISRRGAVRRKSSRDSLGSLTNCDKSDELSSEKANVNDPTHGLSCESDRENLTHDNTADLDSPQAQSVPEMTSSNSKDELASGGQSNICDKDDKTNVTDQTCAGSISDQQDGRQLEETNTNMLSFSGIASNEKPEEDLDIEKDFHSDSGIDSFDGFIRNDVGQSESFDTGKEELLHSCDYYDIKSTYHLKNILDQYSRLCADEEEVGVEHPPKGICLSSYHLLHVEGRWVVENDVEIDEENDESSEYDDCEIFKLPVDIKALYNRSKRTWVVQRMKVSEQVEEEVLLEPSSDQLTSSDASSEYPANENPSSMEEDFRTSTWESKYHPLTINHCGQHFRPLDDSYEPDDEQPATSQDYTEIGILDDAIRKLFYHMEKYRDLTASECLNDKKYPDVRRLVCVELCSALNSIFSNGLKKKFTLLSAIRYSVWEVVKGTCTNEVTGAIVKKINSVGALDDKTRFELFVCECLNQKAGALALWVEALQNDKKKMNTYYDEKALVMKLPKDTLEKLVSRITFLPFSINYYQHVQKKMKEASDVTQFAFE